MARRSPRTHGASVEKTCPLRGQRTLLFVTGEQGYSPVLGGEPALGDKLKSDSSHTAAEPVPRGGYLHLDAGRANEEQGVSIPDVDLQRLSGQVVGEPVLLSWLQEPGVHHVPQLEAGGACAEEPGVSPRVIGAIYHPHTRRYFCSGHDY